MSIRFRLTLWNVALVALSLISFSVISYFLLEQLAISAADETLRLRAVNVSDSLRVNLYAQIYIPSVDEFAAADTFVQIMEPNGRIAKRSDNLGSRQLPIDDGLFTQNLRGQEGFVTTNVDGGRLRIYSVPVFLVRAGPPVLVIQVGRSLTELDNNLRALRFVFGGGIASILLLATGISWLIIRQGLRPITTITALAERIQRAEDMQQRIEYAGPADEVGRLAATFNNMLERIQRAFEAQQRFLADASHSLRTPLTTIQGNVELLLRSHPEDPEEERILLEAVRRETRRLTRVVGDLLLLAQADAGQSFQRIPVEMMTLVLEVYQQARTIADGVHVALGHEDIGLVAGDPDRLKEVLLNLTDNAVKYTPQGGKVTLSLYADGPWVRVEVADTGPGIPPEHLPHIFERFYRVPGIKARPGRPSGTGLGLPIAKWIVESHGGRLTVDSKVGQGTTFTIWLPAVPMH
ncbi:MAG: HAMP domain-containing histidine kinase [Anaerolineae bacterium]|nr:HAMP domain-containing histidine kinase [Anaerolineae bacterium]